MVSFTPISSLTKLAVSALTRKLALLVTAEARPVLHAARASAVAADQRKWQSCGSDVRVALSASIAHPRGMAVGNGVEIGEHAMIDAQGGILIGDRARIGARAILMSSAPLAPGAGHGFAGERSLGPIEIGADAALEPGVTVLPGARIGAGAVVLAGTVVQGEVEPGAVVAPAPPVTMARAEAAGTAPGPASRGAGSDLPTGRERHPDIAFVLTTGRSGSTALADILDRHPRIRARHEPRMQFIAWSTQFARGEISHAEMVRRLQAVFLEASVFDPALIHVESDQKYFNLVEALHAVMPRAKFIWLTRPADAVVASAYARGWYREEEPGLFEEEVYWAWKSYRLTGPDTGDVSHEDWSAMDGFERNAWYWAHVNRTIGAQLARLPRQQWMWADIETIEARLPEILRFLGVETSDLPVMQSNASTYGRHAAADWSDSQRASYERHCGALMQEIYEEQAFA